MSRKLTLNPVGSLIVSDLLDDGWVVRIVPSHGKFFAAAYRIGESHQDHHVAVEVDVNYALMKVEYLAVGKGYHMGELKGSDGFSEEQRGKKVLKHSEPVPIPIEALRSYASRVAPFTAFDKDAAAWQRHSSTASAECACKTLINGHEAGCPLAGK